MKEGFQVRHYGLHPCFVPLFAWVLRDEGDALLDVLFWTIRQYCTYM
jgi:hypothetical protein